MMTCLWLPKRSRSSVGPLGPSKMYSFSILTVGSLRRSELRASRWRVNSFSFLRSSLRATSHSARDTVFGSSSLLPVDAAILVSFRLSDPFKFHGAGVAAQPLRPKRGYAGDGRRPTDHQQDSC